MEDGEKLRFFAYEKANPGEKSIGSVLIEDTPTLVSNFREIPNISRNKKVLNAHWERGRFILKKNNNNFNEDNRIRIEATKDYFDPNTYVITGIDDTDPSNTEWTIFFTANSEDIVD